MGERPGNLERSSGEIEGETMGDKRHSGAEPTRVGDGPRAGAHVSRITGQ